MLYSNEIVFSGHPDKVCDQISDNILTNILAVDPSAHCGIEVMGGKNKIFITGEVSCQMNDIESIVMNSAYDTLTSVKYSLLPTLINNISHQSPDIAQGVNIGGAGDQGMMFGFATRETDTFVPKAQAILQKFAIKYDEFREETPALRSDGKAQITGIYDDNWNLLRIKTFTISYQNNELNRRFTDKLLTDEARRICAEYNIEIEEFLINPTGRFEMGGFAADAGLTGRKIVVDNYHSFAPVGGGAFSGKDPTKVDRSGAYKARQIAVNYLSKFPNINRVTVQLSYAIGVPEPLAIYISADGKSIIPPDQLYAECTPANIIKEFDLTHFDYTQTAKYGHFGLNFPWDKIK